MLHVDKKNIMQSLTCEKLYTWLKVQSIYLKGLIRRISVGAMIRLLRPIFHDQLRSYLPITSPIKYQRYCSLSCLEVHVAGIPEESRLLSTASRIYSGYFCRSRGPLHGAHEVNYGSGIVLERSLDPGEKILVYTYHFPLLMVIPKSRHGRTMNTHSMVRAATRPQHCETPRRGWWDIGPPAPTTSAYLEGLTYLAFLYP